MKVTLYLLCGLSALGAYVGDEARATGASFYVDSTNGNDLNGGLSPQAGWRTLTNVNNHAFAPGDTISFVRGGAWSGQLHPLGSGTVDQHIRITSFGNSLVPPPRIDGGGISSPVLGGAGGAILLRNQAYWDIEELEVTNTGASPGQYVGILIVNCATGVLNHISITNTSVHDVNALNNGYYGTNAGIAVVSCVDTSTSGDANDPRWHDVTIVNNSIARTERIGIFVGPAWQNNSDYPNNWPSIQKSDAIQIAGNSIDASEDAILTFIASDVTIAGNVVSNGGQHNQGCPSPPPPPTPFYCNGSVVAIWISIADEVTIEYNEVYNQGSADRGDGQAFDVEGGSNVSLQYNYSHDNPFGMFLSWEPVLNNAPDSNRPNAPNNNLKIRYNLSSNDGTEIFKFCPSAAAGGGFPHGVDPVDIANNTIYLAATPASIFQDCAGGSTIPNLAYIYNNIIVTPGTFAYPAYPAMNGAVFDSNLFYSVGPHPDNEPADAHKITADPRFVSAAPTGVGFANTTGLQLTAGSPAIAIGVNTGYLGSTDFWSNFVFPENSAVAPSIGAYNGVGIAPTVNLALRTSATASSSYEVYPWHLSNAFDGQQGSWNNSFGYSSQPSSVSTSQWIELDFASSRTFNQVVLFPRADPGQLGAGFPIDFEIQVWDGANWLTRVSRTGSSTPSGPQAFTWGFSDVTNKIRIFATNLRRDAHNDFVMQFAEIEVHEI